VINRQEVTQLRAPIGQQRRRAGAQLPNSDIFGSFASSSDSAARRSAAFQSPYSIGVDEPTPLILVDVDGVLNPSQPEADSYRRYWVFPNGVPHRISLHPKHGQMLSQLSEAANADLVWATYWGSRANIWIAPRIGLPSIRHIPIPSRWSPRARSSLGKWKAAHVAAWIGQTPFVWFEDDPGVPDYLAQRSGLGQHLIVTVNPATGLMRHHLEQAEIWLTDLRANRHRYS
jgi:hypothetical protein